MSTEHTLDSPTRIRRSSPQARAGEAVRNHPLAAFFILTYAFSWSLSSVYLLTSSGPAILSCGPFIAAIAVLSLTSGKQGIKALFHSMLKWRVGRRWWAVAILAPVAMTALATALNLALGAPTPSANDFARWTNILPTALIILLVPVVGGAWEEPGWRGYSLPRLLRGRSPLTASLILGALWAGWHLPVFLTGDQHWSDLLLIVAVTIVLTWLFQNALGSVLIAMVFHAMNNAVSGEYFSQMFTGNDSTRQSWMLVIVWTAAAALVVLLNRGFRQTRQQLGYPASRDCEHSEESIAA